MFVNNQRISRGILYISAFLILFSKTSFAEHPDSTFLKIQNRGSCIQTSAEIFGINSAVLKSIVFIERTLNYDWKDDAFDSYLAQAGRNSSIGFCQVKMKTAFWIEVQLSDSTSEFFPGYQYQDILHLSKSPAEIIKKLQIDSLNIHYAAAYLKIIQSYWQRSGYPIIDRPDILGTLYSIGLFNNAGKVRKPHAIPKPNDFGKKALKAYELFND